MVDGPFQVRGDRADVAAGWVERLTAGAASERDLAELRAWVAADPLNRQAYEAARAVWTALPESRLRSRKVRLAPFGMALAASVAALMLLPGSHDFKTKRGEILEERLPDGTIAWLDGGSALDVRMDGDRRAVTVAAGRVAFKVARDARPFSVSADRATVTDIGTEFVVDREDRLRVAVREGEVEVTKGNETVRLKAGEGAQFDGSAGPFPDAANQFAWRDGRIVLNSVPLADALHELGRYYPGSIELTDDRLASRRVSGTLFIADPEEALETIVRSQHLKITHFLWITRVSPDRK